MSQVVPDPLRPVEKYRTSPRCANCPHSEMLHIQTGKCLQCDCRGFEADPVPEAVVDAKTGEEIPKELMPGIPDSEGDSPRTDYGTPATLLGKPFFPQLPTDVRVPSWVPDFNASATHGQVGETRYGETTPAQTVDPNTATQTSATVPGGLLEKSDILLNSHHGSHYHGMAIEPIQVIELNKMGYHEGNALKYLMRWKVKNGLDDLKKARFYIDRLIEITEGGGSE